MCKSELPRQRPKSLTGNETTTSKIERDVIPTEAVYTASYIAEMTDGLLSLARLSNFEFISYLLEQARQEADSFSIGSYN